MPSGAPVPESAGDDVELFVARYRELAPALHVWASVRIGPELRAHCDVDDLLQEVWCRAFAIRDRFDAPQAAFRPWLFRIAKNVLLEVLRRARQAGRVANAGGGTTRMFALDQVADEVTSISRQVARDESLRTFRDRIDALPDRERDLVVHVGLEGLDCAAAAARLGDNHEAVRKRWQRLRQRLAEDGAPVGLLGG